MARYSKKAMTEKSLEVIKKYKCIFINEIFAFTPFSRALFYLKELDKLDEIKEAIETNKIEIKAGLRQKWYKGNNAITQLALYKLTGTEDERRAITSAQMEVKGSLKIKKFKVGYDEDKEKPPSEEKGSEQ